MTSALPSSEIPIVTITFLQLKQSSRFWAFKQMGVKDAFLSKVPGLTFYKLCGSGAGNGFSIWPSWSVYAIICSWKSEAHARLFFSDHPYYQHFQSRSTHQWTIFMTCSKTHGLWDGETPFLESPAQDLNGTVAVITRARVGYRFLFPFWRRVPSISKLLGESKALFSKGIGEWPIFQLVTFSIWPNEQSMKQFAYQSDLHQEVIKRVRTEGWYPEEMFARFQPFATIGSWEGTDPLPF